MQIIKLFGLLIFVLFLKGEIKGFDPLFSFVVALSIVKPYWVSIPFAFSAGFLEDSLYSVGFINTLTKTLSAYVFSFSKNFFSMEASALAPIFGSIGSIFLLVLFNLLLIFLK